MYGRRRARDTIALAVADMTEEDLSAASKSRATDANKVIAAVATAFANLRTTLQLVLQHHRIGVLRIDTVLVLLDVRSRTSRRGRLRELLNS